MSQPTEPQQRIVLFAVFCSAVFLPVLACVLVLGKILPEGQLGELDGSTARLLGVALLVVGGTAVPLSFFLRGLILRGGGQVFQAMIVAMALCEAASVMGFVHALLSGSLAFAAVLWTFGIVGAGAHFFSPGNG